MKQGKVAIIDNNEDSVHRQGLGQNAISALGYPKLKVDFSGWAAIPENDVAAKKIIEAIELRNKYMTLLDSQYTPIVFTNEAHRKHTRGCCFSRGCRQRFNSVCTCQPQICGEGAGAQLFNRAELKARDAQGRHAEVDTTVQLESDDESEDAGEEEEDNCVKEGPRKSSHGPEVFESERVKREIEAFISAIPSGEEFLRDYDTIVSMCTQGPVPGFAAKRLKVLDYKYSFHRLLNSKRESYSMKLLPKDRVSIIKVDTRKNKK